MREGSDSVASLGVVEEELYKSYKYFVVELKVWLKRGQPRKLGMRIALEAFAKQYCTLLPPSYHFPSSYIGILINLGQAYVMESFYSVEIMESFSCGCSSCRSSKAAGFIVSLALQS